MANYETPEILRLPLEELCLRIKVCGLGSIRQVLGDALDAPSEKMIDNAILTLQEVKKKSIKYNCKVCSGRTVNIGPSVISRWQ
jgi:ATP-dependent RNA helicase DHX29